MVRCFLESFGSCCPQLSAHEVKARRHLRNKVHVIYCERAENHGKYETSDGQEKFVNRCWVILGVQESASSRAANLRLRMLTRTVVVLWRDHQNACAETMQI